MINKEDFEIEDAENAAEEYLSDPENISGVDFEDLVNIFVAGAIWYAKNVK